jgi:hypothetical protein
MPKQTHEYKVITQSDKFFSDSFDPYKLQALLNDLAGKGWRLVSSVSGDFWDWTNALTGSRRGQVLFVLEREYIDTSYRPDQNVERTRSTDQYDPDRIPQVRWYSETGNVSTILRNAGLVTKEQLDLAREHFAKRGGHLCDHLLALGYVTEEELQGLFGKRNG